MPLAAWVVTVRQGEPGSGALSHQSPKLQSQGPWDVPHGADLGFWLAPRSLAGPIHRPAWPVTANATYLANPDGRTRCQISTGPSWGQGDSQREARTLRFGGKRGPFTCLLRQRRGTAKARRGPKEHRLDGARGSELLVVGRTHQGRPSSRLPRGRRWQEAPLGGTVRAAVV